MGINPGLTRSRHLHLVEAAQAPDGSQPSLLDQHGRLEDVRDRNNELRYLVRAEESKTDQPTRVGVAFVRKGDETGNHVSYDCGAVAPFFEPQTVQR